MSIADIDGFIKSLQKLDDDFKPKMSVNMPADDKKNAIKNLKSNWQKLYKNKKISDADVLKQLDSTKNDELMKFFYWIKESKGKKFETLYGQYVDKFFYDENKDETDVSEDETVGEMVGISDVSTDPSAGAGAGAQEARKVIPAGTVEGEVDDREKRLREMKASKARMKETRDETERANSTRGETVSGNEADDEDTETESVDVSDIITEAGTGSGIQIEAEEEKEEERTTKEAETQTPNVSMSINRVELPRSKEEKEMKEKKEKKKADFIPRERLAVTLDELRDDIKYFLKEFKPQLKEEATSFKRVKTLDDLQRLHRRIIGKLQPDEEPKEEKRRMLEVDMERYIDERVQRLIMENMMSSVKPEAVMIDVEGQAKKKAKDVGSYELKANKGGKMFAKREPIYRAIPSTNPEDIPKF